MVEKFTFPYIIQNTKSEIDVRPIELLAKKPTYRIAQDHTFLGYIQRLSAFQYETISSRPIQEDILQKVIEKIENQNND